MDEKTKEVYFSLYCNTCKYAEQDENKDPCCECLANGFNMNSHRPVNWKEKEE